jgi:hypothetical protein
MFYFAFSLIEVKCEKDTNEQHWCSVGNIAQ